MRRLEEVAAQCQRLRSPLRKRIAVGPLLSTEQIRQPGNAYAMRRASSRVSRLAAERPSAGLWCKAGKTWDWKGALGAKRRDFLSKDFT